MRWPTPAISSTTCGRSTTDVAEIRCQHDTGARLCNRFLGELEGGTVRIRCPQCGGWHELAISDLVDYYLAYLVQVRQVAKGNQFLEGLHK